jgi:hypothetical protein
MQFKQINQPDVTVLQVYYLTFVSLNMFRAPPPPSSGAYNCINSLWFLPWSVLVAPLLATNNVVTTTLQGKTRGC